MTTQSILYPTKFTSYPCESAYYRIADNSFVSTKIFAQTEAAEEYDIPKLVLSSFKTDIEEIREARLEASRQFQILNHA